jgi:hypothetical protein
MSLSVGHVRNLYKGGKRGREDGNHCYCASARTPPQSRFLRTCRAFSRLTTLPSAALSLFRGFSVSLLGFGRAICNTVHQCSYCPQGRSLTIRTIEDPPRDRDIGAALPLRASGPCQSRIMRTSHGFWQLFATCCGHTSYCQASPTFAGSPLQNSSSRSGSANIDPSSSCAGGGNRKRLHKRVLRRQFSFFGEQGNAGAAP